MLVTRKVDTGPFSGNSIFLPAAGYRYDLDLRYAGIYGCYWSSSLDHDEGSSGYARSVYVGSGLVDRYYGIRCYGQSLRPLSE